MIDWNDALFAADAHGWMVLLYEYEKMLRLDARQNTRHHIPPLWTNYAAQFPKTFIDLFDPKDFMNRYGATASTSKPPIEKEQPRPVTSKLNTTLPQQPIEQLDPMAQRLYNAMQQATRKEPTLPLPAKPKTPLEIARAFKGAKNSDWTPIFQTFEVKGIKFEMCLVPPGEFMMGSEDVKDAKPIHLQMLTEPFWIGVHPVTNAQWRVAVENSSGKVSEPERSIWGDWYNDEHKANHPIVQVTWYQCRDFLNWLGTYWRLPTEQQWEYAARGLDNLIYPFGNDFQSDLVIYDEKVNHRSPAPIGGRPRGACWVGAQDMSGNVWEWTSSIYQVYPYKVDDIRTDGSSYSFRGGSWYYPHYGARAAFRGDQSPNLRAFDVGFRCIYIPSG